MRQELKATILAALDEAERNAESDRKDGVRGAKKARDDYRRAAAELRKADRLERATALLKKAGVVLQAAGEAVHEYGADEDSEDLKAIDEMDGEIAAFIAEVEV